MKAFGKAIKMVPVLDEAALQNTSRLVFDFPVQGVSTFTQQTVWSFRVKETDYILEIVRNDHFDFSGGSRSLGTYRLINSTWHGSIHNERWTHVLGYGPGAHCGGFDTLDAERLFPAKSGGEGPCLETRIVTLFHKVGEVVDNLMSNELL